MSIIVIQKQMQVEFTYKHFIYRRYDSFKNLSNVFHEIHSFINENKDLMFLDFCTKLEGFYKNKKSRSKCNIEYDLEHGTVFINKPNKCLPSIIIKLNIYNECK